MRRVAVNFTVDWTQGGGGVGEPDPLPFAHVIHVFDTGSAVSQPRPAVRNRVPSKEPLTGSVVDRGRSQTPMLEVPQTGLTTSGTAARIGDI